MTLWRNLSGDNRWPSRANPNENPPQRSPSADSIWTHLHVNIFSTPTNEMSEWNNFLRARLGSHLECETANLAIQNNSQLPFKHNCPQYHSFRVVVSSADQVFCSTAPYASCTCQKRDLHTSSIKLYYALETILTHQWSMQLHLPSTNCHMQLCKNGLMMIHALFWMNHWFSTTGQQVSQMHHEWISNQATASSETWPLISLCPSVAIPSLCGKNGWFNSQAPPQLRP